jgi:hypothetical protein
MPRVSASYAKERRERIKKEKLERKKARQNRMIL